jgi:metal-sulfur cluster biosynthetic enzyme
MLQAETATPLRETVTACLEEVVDPCSAASGAPAGLISMGLVLDVEIEEVAAGARVRVDLCITEPGCMMAALFQIAVQRRLADLPGVAEADVRVDHGHVWSPEQMAPEYRHRLADLRRQRLAHMKTLQLSPTTKKGQA